MNWLRVLGNAETPDIAHVGDGWFALRILWHGTHFHGILVPNPHTPSQFLHP